MKKYQIGVREVHISHREVIAASEKEAMDLVGSGNDTEVFCEYSHTLDRDTWDIDEGADVLYDYRVTHLLVNDDGTRPPETLQFWAVDAEHALEQWRDAVKDYGAVDFHSMTVHKENIYEEGK